MNISLFLSFPACVSSPVGDNSSDGISGIRVLIRFGHNNNSPSGAAAAWTSLAVVCVTRPNGLETWPTAANWSSCHNKYKGRNGTGNLHVQVPPHHGSGLSQARGASARILQAEP